MFCVVSLQTISPFLVVVALKLTINEYAASTALSNDDDITDLHTSNPCRYINRLIWRFVHLYMYCLQTLLGINMKSPSLLVMMLDLESFANDFTLSSCLQVQLCYFMFNLFMLVF